MFPTGRGRRRVFRLRRSCHRHRNPWPVPLHRQSPSDQHLLYRFRERENQMKSTPRTTSLNEPDIRPARNHAEAEEIGSLLLEEIAHPGFIPGPEFVWQGQGFLRPTLIGAWSQNRLVGGASLSPYMKDQVVLRLLRGTAPRCDHGLRHHQRSSGRPQPRSGPHRL